MWEEGVVLRVPGGAPRLLLGLWAFTHDHTPSVHREWEAGRGPVAELRLPGSQPDSPYSAPSTPSGTSRTRIVMG